MLHFRLIINALQETSALTGIFESIQRQILAANVPPQNRNVALNRCMQSLEAMISQGWVEASLDPSAPTLNRRAEWSAIQVQKKG
jgi:hypothetical protein